MIATHIDSQSPGDAGDRANLSLSVSECWSILLTSTTKFESWLLYRLLVFLDLRLVAQNGVQQ
jgi:hypothetical protein